MFTRSCSSSSGNSCSNSSNLVVVAVVAVVAVVIIVVVVVVAVVDLIFLISEAQRNFRIELFDLVEAQRTSAIAERHFRTKLKRNLTSAFENSQHNTNTAFFCDFRQKRGHNLQKKTDIYQNYDRNGTKLNSMYRIALFTEKIFESATQLKRNKF